MPASPLKSVNPTNGTELKRFEALGDSALEVKLETARTCFAAFRELPIRNRMALMGRAGEILIAEKERLGKLMTLEMGKPVTAAIQEAEKCATACQYYAERGAELLARRVIKTSAKESYVVYQPIGAVLAVMPWNFPFWQVFRFAAPALVAGNVGLLKHASNVPQCAMAIEEIFRKAGFPEGAFQSLLIGSDRVEKLIADPRIAAVTLTGSEGAGVSVATAAGKAIKKTVLELGGNDPFVIMPSANVEAAAGAAVAARTINNGQSCIAAKRFFVHQAIAAEFTEHFVRKLQALRVGDPLAIETQIGPLATAEIRETVAKQVEESVRAGAKLLCGGQKLDEKGGFFYAPTALLDAPLGSPAASDEIFGPVAALFSVKDLGDAIERANASRYGLGACLFSTDAGEIAEFVERIEAGLCFINGMVVSDARLPFGGVKRSGYGRELSDEGIREFVNIKAVSIA